MSTTTETAPAGAGVGTWNIDPAHTHVEFAVRHMMITTVKGRFTDVTGVVRMHDDDLTKSDVEIRIAIASIDTREPQRDAHLKSPDFFDAERFPDITFRSKRIADVDGAEFKLAGDLTIHGVTREVTLDAASEGRGRDPWGGERAGFSATTKIKRSDYGLKWNQALETGGVLVGDDVKVSLDVELVKQA